MRSLWLLLAPFAAPLVFTAPAEAQVLGPCCVDEAGLPDDRDPDEDQPSLVGVKVRNPHERALKASAEAPITADAPLVNAIGIPLYPLNEYRRGVSDPARVTAVAAPDVIPPSDIFPPCCRIRVLEPEDPPKILVGAKVKNPDKRALEAAAEAQVETALQLIRAIGIPLYPVTEDRRGASEPEHALPTAATQVQGGEIDGPPCCAEPDRKRQSEVSVDAPGQWLDALKANVESIVAVLILLLSMGFWLSTRLRRHKMLEDQPAPPSRPLPNLPSWRVASPVPRPEPEVAFAKARELEPA